jgi:hypothetical protein
MTVINKEGSKIFLDSSPSAVLKMCREYAKMGWTAARWGYDIEKGKFFAEAKK